MIKKIKKYSELHGISGNEPCISNEIKKDFIKINKSTKFIENKLGSFSVLKKNKDSDKTVAIFAHMDEVGLIVDCINEDGTISVLNVGGIDPNTLLAKKVIFESEKGIRHIGIVLSNSIHNNEEKKISFDNLKIFFGADNKKEIDEMGIELGTFLNFESKCEEMNKKYLVGKAMDNRIGVVMLIELYKKIQNVKLNCNIIFGFTVQEEIGLKGISPMLNQLNMKIDELYFVDVSPVDNNKNCKIGEGTLIRLGEQRGIYDVENNNRIRKIANNYKIKTQDYFSKGRTDGAMAQITKYGYKTNVLCVGGLNLHTNNVIISKEDIKGTIELLMRLIYEN